MSILRAANIFDEVAQLFCQSGENFVFILYGICNPSSVWINLGHVRGAHHLERVSIRLLFVPIPAQGRWWTGGGSHSIGEGRRRAGTMSKGGFCNARR